MANKLDKMYYTDFTKYLYDNNIEYTEVNDVDIDYWMECYVVVSPKNSKLKERYFSEDGGHQLFY